MHLILDIPFSLLMFLYVYIHIHAHTYFINLYIPEIALQQKENAHEMSIYKWLIAC